MIYKVGILGATGKMGLEVAALLSQGFWKDGNCLELSAAIGKSQRFTSVEGTEVRSLEEAADEPLHVWIDFSRPEGTMALLERIQCPLVICTTGFDKAQSELIRRASERLPILVASNTSPGMNQLMRWLSQSVPGKEWQVVVEETHHQEKKDAPSGTAKSLISILNEKGLETPTVHVTRAGNSRGTHVLRFIADGEELILEHRVSDRRVFAQGALLAALGLLKKKEPGWYSMEDVL